MVLRLRRSRPRTLVLGMILLALCLWPSLTLARPLTAQQELERAWQLAAGVNYYRHRSDVVQTRDPLPTLAMAGQSRQVDRMRISGSASPSPTSSQYRSAPIAG